MLCCEFFAESFDSFLLQTKSLTVAVQQITSDDVHIVLAIASLLQGNPNKFQSLSLDDDKMIL